MRPVPASVAIHCRLGEADPVKVIRLGHAAIVGMGDSSVPDIDPVEGCALHHPGGAILEENVRPAQHGTAP